MLNYNWRRLFRLVRVVMVIMGWGVCSLCIMHMDFIILIIMHMLVRRLFSSYF
jgi:hypothetical protein